MEVYRSVNGFVWSRGRMGVDRGAHIPADVWIYFKPALISFPACSRGRFFFDLAWIAVIWGYLRYFYECYIL